MITELTPDTTSQELFDYITTFLFKQGKPAMSKDKNCRYRAPEGRMCAVGCILPDSIYHRKMENKTVHQLLIFARNNGDTFPITEDGKAYFKALEPHLNLLDALQSAHDHAGYDFSRITKKAVHALWDREFSEIAQRFNLKYEPK